MYGGPNTQGSTRPDGENPLGSGYVHTRDFFKLKRS